MDDFAKTVNPGTIPNPGGERPARISVFCRIALEDGCLSISGVEGPKPSGNCWGSSGQIDGNYRHRDPADDDARSAGYALGPDAFEWSTGWNAELWLDFLAAWKRWHLNDLRPGCEHQSADGWDKRPIDPDKPTTAYGRHFDGQQHDSWNLLGWVRPDEHPEGLLTRPCPTCGYKYGSAWMREEAPTDILDFLRSLPDSTEQPAWV